ncbi:MAG TPA: GtrA family protein [Candidatus Paceibacterota bacterium]
MFLPLSLQRFGKYALIGGGTFAFDLILLYIFTDIIGINYVAAAGIGFLIAVSINYYLSRMLVFKGTERTLKTGYVYFLLIAGTGLFFVMSAMFILVEILGFHYLLSRICIAGVTGFWNYLTNLYFNFKMAGRH